MSGSSKDFSQQVAGFMDTYKKRLYATAQGSVQETVEIAQEVGLKSNASEAAKAKALSLGEGKGRMRVHTGFLRASAVAGIGQMPSGESVNPSPNTKDAFNYTGDAISATIARWQPNQVLYIGWTANYARAREYRDGFLRGATEKWNHTVDQVAQKVRRSL